MNSEDSNSVLGLSPADLMLCRICSKPLKNPRKLPCAHTVCLECLQGYGMMTRPGDSTVCPCSCSETFVIPPGGFVQLPGNIYASLLVELVTSAAETSESSDEVIENNCNISENDQELRRSIKTCDICNVDIDSNHTARYCRDCCRTFCERCLAVHSKIPGFDTHEVFLDKLVDQRGVREFIYRTCDKHPNERIDCYCHDCESAFCQACVKNVHNEHRTAAIEDVSEITEMKLISSIFRLSHAMKECLCKMNELRVYVDQVEAVMEDVENRYPTQEISDPEQPMRLQPRDVNEEYLIAKQNKKRAMSNLEATEELHGRMSKHCERLRNLRNRCPRQEMVFLVKDLVSVSDHFIDEMNFVPPYNRCFLKDSQHFSTCQRGNPSGILVYSMSNDYSWNWVFVRPEDGDILDSDLQCEFAPSWTGVGVRVIAHRNTAYAVGLGQQNRELWSWFNEYRRWIRHADMPYTRACCGVVAVEENIIALGGKRSVGLQACNIVQSFNIETCVWSVIGKLTRAVYDPICLVYDGKVYVFGGLSNSAHTNYIQIFDARTNECKEARSVTPFSHKLNAIVWDIYAIFIGKVGCWLYNFKTDAWLKREYFCVKMEAFGMYIEKCNLLCVGGGITSTGRRRLYVKQMLLDDILNDTHKFHYEMDMPADYRNVTFVTAAPGVIMI